MNSCSYWHHNQVSRRSGKCRKRLLYIFVDRVKSILVGTKTSYFSDVSHPKISCYTVFRSNIFHKNYNNCFCYFIGLFHKYKTLIIRLCSGSINWDTMQPPNISTAWLQHDNETTTTPRWNTQALSLKIYLLSLESTLRVSASLVPQNLSSGV